VEKERGVGVIEGLEGVAEGVSGWVVWVRFCIVMSFLVGAWKGKYFLFFYFFV
jgi:hypothetical protein